MLTLVIPALLVLAGTASASSSERCIGCAQCHVCSGSGELCYSYDVAVEAYNGSAYAVVNGTTIYSNHSKELGLCTSESVDCEVNDTGLYAYSFVNWYSSTLELASTSECSTTITALGAGSSEVLSILMAAPTSESWAGYGINLTDPASLVGATFTVPTTSFISPSQTGEEVSEWAGIGGQEFWWPESGGYLWQAGVSEQYLPNGTLYTYLWYEAYPALPVCSIPPTWHGTGYPPYVTPSSCSGVFYPSFEPSEGDEITVLLSLYFNEFASGYYANLTFQDGTTGQNFTALNNQMVSEYSPLYHPVPNQVDYVVESTYGFDYPLPDLTSAAAFTFDGYVLLHEVDWSLAIEPNFFAQFNAYGGTGYLCPEAFDPSTGTFSVTYSTSSC